MSGHCHFINVSLPLNGNGDLFEVIVRDGRFVTVVPQRERAATDKFKSFFGEGTPTGGSWDLQGRVMLPGFVDSHMHLDKAFSLPQVPNQSGTLAEALRNFNEAYPSIGKEDIKSRMRQAALKSLSYGSTAFRTHLDFNLQAGKEVAFRTIHAALEVREELRDRIDIQLFPLVMHDKSFGAEEMEAVEETLIQGVDGIGSIPHISSTPEQDIDHMFRLAGKYGCPVDFHTDESDDPAVQTISFIADATERYGYQGRVVAGHLCSLAAMDDGTAQRLIGKMKHAGIGAVTLPAANMYLQGREDRGIVRRGITRVREIQEAGVPIAAASDNIHDPFHPFGRGDLIQIGLLTAYAAHYGGAAEQATVLRMLTDIPAAIVGLTDYGIAPGRKADFVVLNACKTEDIFTFLPEDRAVFKQGRLIHTSRLTSAWNETTGGMNA